MANLLPSQSQLLPWLQSLRSQFMPSMEIRCFHALESLSFLSFQSSKQFTSSSFVFACLLWQLHKPAALPGRHSLHGVHWPGIPGKKTKLLLVVSSLSLLLLLLLPLPLISWYACQHLLHDLTGNPRNSSTFLFLPRRVVGRHCRYRLLDTFLATFRNWFRKHDICLRKSLDPLLTWVASCS